ncbi:MULTISPECIES: HNH endonuclease [Kitasatospora]|uniref:5-methylcytosine-specific restriction endonuclease McrA n=2 Tax=Kitasatospora TaxID=2063 RepID=A0ABT1IS58_9ACTN|nr:HNH endonuclease [Kitasatospora paracochleata]MCP2307968.1 5-methylcytosine-specific restriction endonuclease McrA [Kitasatospora paracochleata]
MPHVLVLNASYEPLGVVSMRRALILVLNHKAVSLEDSEITLHSATAVLPAPSVVRLTRFVRVPYRGPVPLTRRALFARDHGRCVYCGAAATSVDHVIPRSRGGQHRWDNVVAACRRCNHTKADRHLADLGWRMKHPPAAPAGLAWRVIGTGIKDPRWRPYLEPYGGLEQFRDFEHHDHTDHGGALPAPLGRSHPVHRGEHPEPLSA